MAKKAPATADKPVEPTIVAGVGIAVGTSRNTDERKRALEAALKAAIEKAIADGEAAGTGFPPDAVIRQALVDATEAFKAAEVGATRPTEQPKNPVVAGGGGPQVR